MTQRTRNSRNSLMFGALLLASAAFAQPTPETQPETPPQNPPQTFPSVPPLMMMPMPTTPAAPAPDTVPFPPPIPYPPPPSIPAYPSELTPPAADLMQPAPTPSPSPALPAALPETQKKEEKNPVMEMPEFLGIAGWLNSPPLTKEALKGKVVLVDFWTYSCVNCVRTLPHLKDWYKKYKDRGFVIVGVHSPEFDFEKDLNNVKLAVQKFGITYPVALDNQMATWAAYQNNVWPAHYFIDHKGKVRHIHLGEGEYEKSEQMIQKLLTEKERPETQPAETQPAETKPAETKPAAKPAAPPAMPALSKIPLSVDFSQIKSPETYLGLLRRERLVTSGRPIELNEWMFDGKWRTEGDRIFLVEGTGKVYFRFNAVKVNVVMAPTAGGVQAVVKLDGQTVLPEKSGADVKNGTVMITEPRMYELINLGGKGEEHIIEIEFLNPGVAVYAFTFG